MRPQPLISGTIGGANRRGERDRLAQILRVQIYEGEQRLPPEEATDVEIVHLAQWLAQLPPRK